jgi:PAS domain S-box-containing protein
MATPKGTEKNEKNTQELIDGLTRAAQGDLASKIRLTGKDPGLADIAQAANELIKAMRATADIARESQAQQEQMNRKLRRIFDGASDVILLVNKYGTCIDVNRRVENILGYKPDELKGKHFAKSGVIPEDKVAQQVKVFQAAMEKGEVSETAELELQAKNGNLVYVEAGTRIIWNGDEILGAVIVIRDIGLRHMAVLAACEQRKRLQAIISSMEDLVFAVDPDLRVTDYYPPEGRLDTTLYTPPGEFTGKSMKNFLPTHLARELEKVIRTAMKKKEKQHYDFPWRLLGVALWFNAEISPLREPDGAVTGAAVVISDITDRKNMEKTLEENEKKYRKIFENSPQGFLVLDTEGHIVDINKKLCDWLGYKPEEMLGKDHILYPFLTKAGKILAMKKFFQRLTGKSVPAYDLEFVTKRGEIFIGEVRAMQLRDDQGEIQQILVMITDVTDRPPK